MDNNNVAIYSSKIIADIVWGVFYFPLWWYGAGLIKFMLTLGNFIAEREQAVGFLVWLKNIGKPMYGQRDFAGVLISIFIRLIQIIVRGVIMLFWLAMVLLFLAVWLGLPIITLYEIFYQIIPS
jgi:hypothetical protein